MEFDVLYDKALGFCTSRTVTTQTLGLAGSHPSTGKLEQATRRELLFIARAPLHIHAILAMNCISR